MSAPANAFLGKYEYTCMYGGLGVAPYFWELRVRNVHTQIVLLKAHTHAHMSDSSIAHIRHSTPQCAKHAPAHNWN